MERIGDIHQKREIFETDRFDKDTLVRTDLHRISEKKRWLSPKGFMPNSRNINVKSMPNSTRNTTDFSKIPEPYEDPKLDPEFVRSTKEFLKNANIKTA